MNMLLNIVYLKRRSFANLLTLLHNWYKNMSVGLFSLVKGRGFPQKSFNCAWKLGGNNSTIESGFPAARTFGLVWFVVFCFVCLFAWPCCEECCLPLRPSSLSLLVFFFFFFDLGPPRMAVKMPKVIHIRLSQTATGIIAANLRLFLELSAIKR